MMKKQILVILAVMCMMSLFVMAASADDGIGNGDGSGCATIGIGNGSGYVTIPITATGADNVGSCDINLTYDVSIVTVVGVSNGHMDNMFSNLEKVGDGWIRIGAYQGSNPGLDGEFVIAHVSFESIADSGSCPLEISVTTFKDATPVGRSMCYEVSNGTYTATSNGGGNGNGDDDGDGNGDDGDGNVTPTITPTVTPTSDDSPTPSPTKTLPDDDPIGDGNWGFIAVFAIAGILLIAYLVLRRRDQ